MDDLNNYVNLVIQVTSEGKASEWNDRIASLAADSRIPLELINWVGSPRNVSREVVMYAKKNCTLSILMVTCDTKRGNHEEETTG